MMNKSTAIIALIFGSLMISATGWADNLPDYYPSSFHRWGVIDRLDIAGGDVVVNDTLMHISENVKIHTPNTQFATVHALNKGAKIGVAFSTTSPVKRMIDEIWILPGDYGASSE